ncbi:carboxyl-terminal-processing peptidase 1, chloroplastic-like isoform X2 [Iris pallida]|uniref:Carboxyl-terminal-processing peptidase 1, chloroplastic-like isoform X2 n=1 Tax=Iris pallida TaxID=29817 RepID=A0AAX6EWR9_IRIPA|nr:carboxyl-terminal-processing peptidase 1, chloroplastic-like isoform X2 [Iris pallida]
MVVSTPSSSSSAPSSPLSASTRLKGGCSSQPQPEAATARPVSIEQKFLALEEGTKSVNMSLSFVRRPQPAASEEQKFLVLVLRHP